MQAVAKGGLFRALRHRGARRESVMPKSNDDRNSSSPTPRDSVRSHAREASEQDEARTPTGLEQARAAVEQTRGIQQTDNELVNSSVERLKALLEKIDDALSIRRGSQSSSSAGSCPTGCELGPYTGLSRKLEAFLRRLDPAVNQLLQPLP